MIEAQENKQENEVKNKPYYCDSIGHLKSYYLQGNASDVDVSVFLQKYFNYSLEEAHRASFNWRYGSNG